MGNDPRDKYMREVLSRNLTQRIKDSGQTQAQVAAASGIGANSLSSYCKGVRFPRPEVLRALADYFNVSVGELTDDETTRTRAMAGLSQEAATIAALYDELDQHGRTLVRIVVDAELQRVRDKQESD